MKTNIFACLAVVVFTFLPGSATAYFTTDQEAFTVDGKVGLYTIDFRFGHASHDIYIPTKTRLGIDMETDVINYVLLTEDGVADGDAVGIVLASLPIVDGMYKIEKGKAATLTLLVLFTSDGPAQSVRAQVNSLPFRFDKTTELKLNPSELQYYSTDYIRLGSGITQSK